MNLTDYTSFVCSKIGQTDNNSVIACASFVQRRYAMIYDAAFWRDSQIIGSTTLTANDDSVLLPSTMERVISLRANGKFLDPVDATFLLETDPTIFERYDKPTHYEEYTDHTDPDTPKKIKFYPKPVIDTTILIVGKRLLLPLTDDSMEVPSPDSTDEPILRGIDNCLLAYVQGDMLQRQRQYAKANELYQEGKAQLDLMKSVEEGQANRPRSISALTVSGNSLGELTYAVASRCNMWALAQIQAIKEGLRRNYQHIYDSRLWTESTVILNVASDGSQLVMPEYVDRVLDIRTDAGLGALFPVEQTYIFDIAPQIFEQTTGTQVAFATLAPVAVAVLPPGLERLSFVSDYATDKSKVTIWGESEGNERREVLTLNGETEVQTAYEYDYPLTIAKEQTDGTITITGALSTVQLQTLFSWETERKHIRLWLQPNNESGTTCLVLAKRRIRPFHNDMDTPILRDIQMPLIEFTVADMLAHSGNMPGAQEARVKGQAALLNLIALELDQGASQRRVTPITEPDYISSYYWWSNSIVAKVF